MSKILILHSGDKSDAIILNSLIKRLISSNELTIECSSDTADIFRLGGFDTFPLGKKSSQDSYDYAINFSPEEDCTDIMSQVESNEKLGYGRDDSGLFYYNEGTQLHYSAKYIKILTTANQFQLVYGIAREKWKGEGYYLKYFPRNKMRKSMTGVAIRNLHLKEFIFKGLQLQLSHIQSIPIKQNIQKQIDEVNRCKSIITDDMLLLNIGLALHKRVEMLATKTIPYKLELFGEGTIHYLRSNV